MEIQGTAGIRQMAPLETAGAEQPRSVASDRAELSTTETTNDKPLLGELRFDCFEQTRRLVGDFEASQKDFAARFETLQNNGTPMQDPAWHQLWSEQNNASLSFQMRAQAAAFSAELMSKVVEHGTSSTKSILQTQM
ncbi:MAG: hypothetical protein KDC95_14825 [Planctomycetes bacterium]|nr:hypothetical protein [Planctomycetota bacterium]